MEYTELVIAAITLVIVLAYAFHILLFTYGWMRLRMPLRGQGPSPSSSISVIVALRDEEDNLPSLMADLKAQNHPRGLYEVILVDDHSSDGTVGLIEQIISEEKDMAIRLLSLDRLGMPGSKKRAIEAGVGVAKGNLVAVTDADCRLKPGWLSSMAGEYERKGLKMVCGPVQFIPRKGFSARFQEMEFLSLVGSGAGSVGAGRPVFCNGANMVFVRNAFSEVGGYSGNEKYASGDDVFLLHKVRKRYGGGSIGFNLQQDAIVSTAGARGWGGFFRQRIRWASKARGYKDLFSITTALSVYLLNLFLFATLVAGFFVPFYFFLFGYLFIMKLMLDFPLLFGVLSFFKRQGLLAWFLPFEFIYVFYVVLAGVVSLFYGGRWKGRKVGH